MKNRKGNIFFDILGVLLSNIIKLWANVLVGFLLPKIIGVSDYGYYKTFTLYATYITLFTFGFIHGIYLKYGGKNYNEIDKPYFRRVTWVYIMMETIIASILAIVGIVSLDGELKFIFIMLSIYLLEVNIIAYYQYISQVTSRFKELSTRNIVDSILTCISVIILWLLYHFTDIVLSYRYYIIALVVISAFLVVWYSVTYRDITLGKQKQIEFREIISFFKLGIPLLVSGLCSSLILSLDRQFVNILFDTETYAVYAFAYSMLSLITTATSAISTVLYPVLKKNDSEKNKLQYSLLSSLILILVFACILVYFPLCWFVGWFLPKYAESLLIFRIILPGLAIQSVITIIMHNFYKTDGKEPLFFIKSILILGVSFTANLVAYCLFKTTISISFASIIVMVFWYILMEIYFVRNYKAKWIKNFVYMIIMMVLFYLITILELWWAAMFIYLSVFLIITFLFYRKEIYIFINKLRAQNNNEANDVTQ